MYKSIIRPVLFSLFSDPETAHRLVMSFLRSGSFSLELVKAVRSHYTVRDQRLEQTVFGLTFPNPLGLAAGFDKHGEALAMLAALGFGHIEVGTVTRHAQSGNSRQRMFRLVADEAIINRMGFNNAGADAMAARLSKEKKLPVPIGISLGKSKVTPLPEAAEDYLYSFRKLYTQGDYFAINVSSPNTPGLRELQDKAALDNLVSVLQTENKLLAAANGVLWPKPLLVKIAPDLSFEAIDEVLAVCKKYKLSGIVATNTTIARENLKTSVNETGGLSGRPLLARALEVIRHIHTQAPELPIIGAGGIFTAEDAYAMLSAGATLLQAYTGFIYEGPAFVKNINEGLLRILDQKNLSNVAALVGM